MQSNSNSREIFTDISLIIQGVTQSKQRMFKAGFQE